MNKLTLRRQAIKALREMSPRPARRIRHELDGLSENPYRRDLDAGPLRGRPGFRLRVGEIRIIFERDDDACIIDVLRIAPRGLAYRRQESVMNKAQVILDDHGGPAFAVIPWRDYERLTSEDAKAALSDEALYDRAGAEGGESFPPGSRTVFWPAKTRSACIGTIAA